MNYIFGYILLVWLGTIMYSFCSCVLILWFFLYFRTKVLKSFAKYSQGLSIHEVETPEYFPLFKKIIQVGSLGSYKTRSKPQFCSKGNDCTTSGIWKLLSVRLMCLSFLLWYLLTDFNILLFFKVWCFCTLIMLIVLRSYSLERLIYWTFIN